MIVDYVIVKQCTLGEIVGGAIDVNKHGAASNQLSSADIANSIEIEPIDGVTAFECSKAVSEVVGNKAVKYVGGISGKLCTYQIVLM